MTSPQHPPHQNSDGGSGVTAGDGRDKEGVIGEARGTGRVGGVGGAGGAGAVGGVNGALQGPEPFDPRGDGYPGGMPSGTYGASYPAGPQAQAGPQVPGSAPNAYGSAYGAQHGIVPGHKAIPHQSSRAGLFMILAALLTCQLARPFFVLLGGITAGFSLLHAVHGFVFNPMTWLIIVGIVQTAMRRPIPSFIPAAAMSVASSVFNFVLIIAYSDRHEFLNVFANFVFLIISLAEVVMLLIAGWMSCARLRGRPGSPPISVLLPSGAAQFLLVLAAGGLINVPVLLLLSGISESFDQYGADMRLGYALSWYGDSEPADGTVPFGAGLAILIMVGLAAAGAVVMSRPGGSRVTLVAGSAVASGVFLLHSLYATILTFLAELHDRGGSLVIMGDTVPLVIAAALMIGMSLAGLAPSARAWFAGQWPPSQAVHRPPYPGRPPAVQAYRVQGPWSS